MTAAHELDAAVRDLLDQQGPLAAVLPGFQPRECQQTMAAAVTEAIADRAALVVEAGTGTGKTFAYLLPALVAGVRTLVSTGTKALQDQLFHRDLPRLLEALQLQPKVALLKGRANYLCLHRLETAQSEGLFARSEDVTQLRQVRQWASRTSAGDRAELTSVPEDSPLWAQVTSTADNCLGSECPFLDECHVVKARRKAQAADLVVINHHLLFADMALKQEGFGELLPGAELIVLDEAHQLVATATQFFGTSITARQLVDLARDSLREAGEVSGALTALRTPAEFLEQAVRQLRLSLEQVPLRGEWGWLEEAPDCGEALAELSRGLQTLAAALQDLEQASPGLEHCAGRADGLSARLRGLIEGQIADPTEGADDQSASTGAHVRWYECRGRGFSLHSTPLEVAAQLRGFRQHSGAAWVLASATLAVGERFDHYLASTGFEDARTLRLDSPFDYARQAMLLLPPQLPEPNHPAHTQAVVRLAIPLIRAAKGRCFLLFTSHRALREAADRLRGALSYPLFVQGEAPRHQLLEDFRAAGNGVLLGAASFWEGVDVRGDALSLVIIDRLPFAQPDVPLARARADALRRRGLSPFRDLSLPEAVLSLKQGAGRLIRDVEDRGVLVLCDPRIRSKSYGRVFLDSLPPMRRTQAVDEAVGFLQEL
ncbi:MAG: ATP-dependent DNA helicase [Xanthomonadales bacterium]|nr:ATP-dependent DNA helicase [Xanthomonadales bacterium]